MQRASLEKATAEQAACGLSRWFQVFKWSSALAVQIALDILDELIAEGDRLHARIYSFQGKIAVENQTTKVINVDCHLALAACLLTYDADQKCLGPFQKYPTASSSFELLPKPLNFAVLIFSVILFTRIAVILPC